MDEITKEYQDEFDSIASMLSAYEKLLPFLIIPSGSKEDIKKNEQAALDMGSKLKKMVKAFNEGRPFEIVNPKILACHSLTRYLMNLLWEKNIKCETPNVNSGIFVLCYKGVNFKLSVEPLSLASEYEVADEASHLQRKIWGKAIENRVYVKGDEFIEQCRSEKQPSDG